MTADALLQLLTQALFVFVLLAVGVCAIQRPRRANVDTALLFGVVSLISAESRPGKGSTFYVCLPLTAKVLAS